MPSKDVQIKTILTTTDFSKYSRPALDYALHFAALHKAKLHCVHVLQHYPGYNYLYSKEDLKNFEKTVEEKARAELEKFIEPAEYGKISINLHVRAGKASYEIIKAAQELKANLIVIATHGEGYALLQKAIFGSTAANIVSHSPVPVLCVPSLNKK